MKKRIIGVLLACVMILTVLPALVGADDAAETEKLVISIAKDAQLSNTKGSTVRVAVEITENPGIVSLTLPVVWNNNVLKLTGVEQTDGVIKEGWLGYTEYEKITDTYYLAWNNDTKHDGSFGEFNYTDKGTLCVLVFELLQDVVIEEGKPAPTYPVTLVQPGDDNAIMNIMNWKMEDFLHKKAEDSIYGVTVELNNGLITMIDRIPGDVDGVEGLTSEDAIYLMFHILFKGTMFEEDYQINESIDLDYDSSGVVDSEDAIYLMFHVLFKDTMFAEDYILYPKK